jgi:TonB family protein
MKQTLTFLFTNILVFNGWGQTDTLLRYLNSELRPCEKKNHAYEVVSLFTKLPDGNMMVQDFHGETGKKLQQYYLMAQDTSLMIGPYISYHKNGEVRRRGNYKNGAKLGIWKGWHDNKTLSDSIFYNDEGNISGVARTWFEDGKIHDSAFYHPDSAGRAIKYIYYASSEPWGQGPVWNDVEHGDWKYFRKSGKVSSEETYVQGKLQQIKCYEEDGSLSKSKCEPEQDAYFPGEDKAWMDYIVKSITRKADEMSRRNAVGRCVVLFIVGTDGEIIETKIEQSSGTELDQYAMAIIKRSPKWIPAKQHNILVKAYRKQPIVYNLAQQ